MSEAKILEGSISGIEIGATAPNKLQIIVQAGHTSVRLKMTADEARWLASALHHWAMVSETMSN
jgi:hypothetical protein